MNTVVDFPTIEVPPASVATLKDTALASFAPIEAHMRTLAARYGNVAYPVTTPKGMREAKAARLVLRDEGRYAVQRLVKRLKDEANDLKRVVEARGEEVIAITRPAEDAIAAQIEAEEARIEKERAEAARREQERRDGFESKIRALSGWIYRCREPGMTAQRIATGVDMLAGQAMSEADWAEYLPRALERRAEVLDVMRELHRQAAAREQEAAETERLRKLAEQQAAELAEMRRREDERKAQELAAARAESQRLEAIAEANREALQAQTITTPPVTDGGQVDGCRAPESQPDGCSGPVSQDDTSLPASPPAEKAEQGAESTIKLCDITAWLGFGLTGAFVQETLGVLSCGRDKNAVLFPAEARHRVRDALIRHLQGLR